MTPSVFGYKKDENETPLIAAVGGREMETVTDLAWPMNLGIW